MALDIRGVGNQEALSQIAKLAYGSGTFEGTSGGKGNIGILDGRVVKFNTHWRERGGVPTDAMRANCDALRTKLSDIATSMLSASPEATPEERAKLDKALADVRKLLGMAADGGQVATTRLLDRKVVAKVINTIDKATGFDAWSELRAGGAARAFSSRGVDTTFGSVRSGFDLASIARDAAASLAHPADGKPGVTLNETATKFMTDLIERDVAAREAAGKPVPTRDELDQGIRDFTSPYLAITLQTFNLNSDVLSNARPRIDVAKQAALFLAESPRGQRADRADVALALFADVSHVNSGPDSAFAMALVSEKMPEMRRLQPEGRLTNATVWKACFGENVPENLADGSGSRAFSDAFFQRLYRLGSDILAQCGGYRPYPQMSFGELVGLVLPRATAGMGFTASIRLFAQDPEFRLDAARDFVAAPVLYNVEDALVKSESQVRHQVMHDFLRSTPTIRLHDGQDVQDTFDFADALEEVKRQTQDLTGTQRDIETNTKFREKSDAFVEAFDARYGGRMTEAQRKVVLFGLTQAGHQTFGAVDHLKENALRKMTMDVRREDDGAFVISYASDRELTDEFDVRYSYRIEPDGTNHCVGEFAYAVRFD